MAIFYIIIKLNIYIYDQSLGSQAIEFRDLARFQPPSTSRLRASKVLMCGSPVTSPTAAGRKTRFAPRCNGGVIYNPDNMCITIYIIPIISVIQNYSTNDISGKLHEFTNLKEGLSPLGDLTPARTET